jgi:hypothetical protein
MTRDEVLTSTIGWVDEGSPSFAIDGLRTSAHPIVLYER